MDYPYQGFDGTSGGEGQGDFRPAKRSIWRDYGREG